MRAAEVTHASPDPSRRVHERLEGVMVATTRSSNTTGSQVHENAAESANDVTLIGRIAGAAERQLPSGDALVTFRVIVDRPKRDRGPSGRVRVDAVECSARTVTLGRRVMATAEGAVVEVRGSLRRRFWRGPAGPTSVVEVEARSLRRIDPGPVPR